jgi:predicted PurR-regulated permease PerM
MQERNNRVQSLSKPEPQPAPAPPHDEQVAVSSSIKILGLAALAACIVFAREVILLSFLSILIAVALSYPVGWLSRKIPRGLAVILSLIVVLGGFTAICFAAFPVLSAQLQSVVKQLPGAVTKIQQWYHHTANSGPMAQVTGNGQVGQNLPQRMEQILEKGASALFPAALGVIEAVSTAILVLVLAAFFVYQPGAYQHGLRLLVPKKHEEAFDEGYGRIAVGLRHWVGAIFVAMLTMGTFAAIGLKLAGIENWFLLGILTFLGTFIPYLGAIASAVPGLLVALAQSTNHFLYACLVYLGVHIVEGYIVEPYIMKRAVEIRPAMLLIGQAIFGALFGLLGIVVASPLLVCLQVGVGYFYVERKLGKVPETD